MVIGVKTNQGMGPAQTTINTDELPEMNCCGASRLTPCRRTTATIDKNTGNLYKMRGRWQTSNSAICLGNIARTFGVPPRRKFQPGRFFGRLCPTLRLVLSWHSQSTTKQPMLKQRLQPLWDERAPASCSMRAPKRIPSPAGKKWQPHLRRSRRKTGRSQVSLETWNRPISVGLVARVDRDCNSNRNCNPASARRNRDWR